MKDIEKKEPILKCQVPVQWNCREKQFREYEQIHELVSQSLKTDRKKLARAEHLRIATNFLSDFEEAGREDVIL